MQRVTAEELASKLNGFDIEVKFTRNVIKLAKDSDLIIVSAIGDDTIRFSGALTDEFDLRHGGQIFMDKEGNEYIPYLRQNQNNTRKIIKVFWDGKSLFRWKFLTLIKHVTYDLKREGKCFCKGIIFNINDI